MLENGMIVGAESHDPQCREPQKGYCVQCKQMVPVHELTELQTVRECVMTAYTTIWKYKAQTL